MPCGCSCSYVRQFLSLTVALPSLNLPSWKEVYRFFLLDFQRVTCFPGFHSSLSQTQETERHVSLASWGGAPRAHLRGCSLSTSNCTGSQGTRALQHFPAQCPPRTHFSEAGSSSPHPSFSSILYLSTQSSYHLFLDLTGLLSLSCNPGFPGRRQ